MAPRTADQQGNTRIQLSKPSSPTRRNQGRLLA
uniref:Uncharacterized protein n=1 Tax=Arundo donax TaxID=35708 RepID=A0A0A8YB88_ARUDO